MYPGATGDVGFAIAGNQLQIYADNPNADVAIGYDAAGVFNERFAVKPSGALAVQGNVGAKGQILTSKANGAARWGDPVRSVITVPLNPDNSISCATHFAQTVELPNIELSITIPTEQNARLLLSGNISTSDNGCFPIFCEPRGFFSLL